MLLLYDCYLRLDVAKELWLDALLPLMGFSFFLILSLLRYCFKIFTPDGSVVFRLLLAELFDLWFLRLLRLV